MEKYVEEVMIDFDGTSRSCRLIKDCEKFKKDLLRINVQKLCGQDRSDYIETINVFLTHITEQLNKDLKVLETDDKKEMAVKYIKVKKITEDFNKLCQKMEKWTYDTLWKKEVLLIAYRCYCIAWGRHIELGIRIHTLYGGGSVEEMRQYYDHFYRNFAKAMKLIDELEKKNQGKEKGRCCVLERSFFYSQMSWITLLYNQFGGNNPFPEHLDLEKSPRQLACDYCIQGISMFSAISQYPEDVRDRINFDNVAENHLFFF